MDSSSRNTRETSAATRGPIARAAIGAVLLLALCGCEGPPIPGAKITRSCGQSYVWQDARGNRWVGLLNEDNWMIPVAPGADLNDICGRLK